MNDLDLNASILRLDDRIDTDLFEDWRAVADDRRALLARVAELEQEVETWVVHVARREREADEARALAGRYREALEEIAREDDCVTANEGAFSIYAYRRCRRVAEWALAAVPPPAAATPADEETELRRAAEAVVDMASQDALNHLRDVLQRKAGRGQ